MEQRYYTVKEAAEYLRVSQSLLNQLRGKKSGPVYSRMGSAIRYDRNDLDAWVRERKQ